MISRGGLAGGWPLTSGAGRRSITRSGSTSRPIVSLGAIATARSSAFSSSRTLPGQSYSSSACKALSSRRFGSAPRRLANCVRKFSAKSGMSSRRSRSGGR